MAVNIEVHLITIVTKKDKTIVLYHFVKMSQVYLSRKAKQAIVQINLCRNASQRDGQGRLLGYSCYWFDSDSRRNSAKVEELEISLTL